MNLLNHFRQIVFHEQKAFASITGKRADGILTAQTPSGATVLLKGQADIGQKVFYNRINSTILQIAPDVEFNEYSV